MALTTQQRWTLAAATAALFGLLYLLAPVLTPFAVAAGLAYIGDPLVDKLEAKNLSRTSAVLIVFCALLIVLIAVVLVLVPMLQSQIIVLLRKVPQIFDWLQHSALPWLESSFGVSLAGLDIETLKASVLSHWKQVGGAAASVFTALSQSGMALAGWLANLVLIPVVTFYFLRDWDVMVAKLRESLPRAVEPTVAALARQCDDVLGAFFRGQLSVMLALAVVYTAGLSLVGLDLALLIGMVAGLVSFVPYLGFIVGFGAASLAAALQFHDFIHVVYVGLVFGFGQLLESFALTPILLGDRIGLHPVMVIFALMVGGQLFGFFGILMALPVAAVVMVVLRYAHDRYLRSTLYGPST